MRMLAAIQDRENFFGMCHKAGLLVNFTDHIFCGGGANISPTSWQSPFSVGAFAHQQDFVIAENHSPHVHFWGAIARVFLEQFEDKSLILPGTLGQHLGNDAPEILIPFEVVSIPGESNAVLRNGLKALAPFEPSSVLGRGHQT
jgi:hypothetical protein